MQRSLKQWLAEAEQKNPGDWISHSYYVAQAAKLIAQKISSLDEEVAYKMGLLHDIGRREGKYKNRHTLDGYKFLMKMGYPELARISITHVFTYPNCAYVSEHFDCSEVVLPRV